MSDELNKIVHLKFNAISLNRIESSVRPTNSRPTYHKKYILRAGFWPCPLVRFDDEQIPIGPCSGGGTRYVVFPLNASSRNLHTHVQHAPPLSNMTPRTRSSDAIPSPKVYRSKKVPQQACFPHKRKTVRRRSTPVPNEDERQQLVFLPEKMKLIHAHTIGDSDEEGDGMELEEENTIATPKERADSQSKKRSRVVIEEDTETEKESTGRNAKRQRKCAAPRQKRRSKRAETLTENVDDADSTDTKEQKSRKRRRQSTMTQLVEGRLPMSDTEEPDFKPVKRSPRLSLGGKGKGKKAEKDKQQRTLTQMVPGMRSFEVSSDDDMEEALGDLEVQEENSQEYDDAIAQRLARQGLHRVESHTMDRTNSGDRLEDGVQSVKQEAMHENAIPSVEDTENEDEEEESYRPTQYIDAPATRSNRTLRRRNGLSEIKSEPSKPPTVKSPRPSRSRFSLLQTPEKRRIFEIPSSQSPAESPFSAQVSPQKMDRPPLNECSGNPIQAPETPSGRKKVTFQEGASKLKVPPTLKRFQSTIQDSEDEEEDFLDDDASLKGQQDSVHTRTQTPSKEKFLHGIAVGADTQAMLEQIDQVCANAEEDAVWLNREFSEEVSGSTTDNKNTVETDEKQQNIDDFEEHEGLGDCSNSSPLPKVKREPSYNDNMAEFLVHEKATFLEVQQGEETPNLSHETPQFEPSAVPPSTPPLPSETYPQETFPSTPMVIQDDSEDEGDDPVETTPPTAGKTAIEQASGLLQHSTDLDGDLVQVPASPTWQKETQQSHSSKAEQQLQAEWFSYSQYLDNCPPQESSMNVGHDTFSYNARRKNTCPSAPNTLPSNPHHLQSQATTVDEVTPKKNRTHNIFSVTETPHQVVSSPTYSISPIKPPPLFIPSSFPSPGEAGMEGWSSPALGKTQDGFGYLGSLEDMSIPPPPPAEED